MIDCLLALGIIMHRRLEEETQETLDTITASTGSQIAQQGEVEQQWSCQDRVTTEEINLDLFYGECSRDKQDTV